MRLNDKWYSFLKWTALIFLPALAVLVATVMPVWNLAVDYVKPIVVTINAVSVFIGALIGISQATIAQEDAAEEYIEGIADGEEPVADDIPEEA